MLARLHLHANDDVGGNGNMMLTPSSFTSLRLTSQFHSGVSRESNVRLPRLSCRNLTRIALLRTIIN